MKRLFLSVLLGLCLFSFSASAQVSWLHGDYESRVSLESSLIKGTFIDDIDYTFPTSVTYLSANFEMSDRISLHCELPFAYYHIRIPYAYLDEDGMMINNESYKSNTIGNPYFGFRYKIPRGNLYLNTGLRIPMVDRSEFVAAEMGATSFYDRTEAFLQETFSFSFGMGYIGDLNSYFSLKVEGGFTYIDTDDTDYDNEPILNHNAVINYRKNVWALAAGYSGRYLLSRDAFFFEDRYAGIVGLKVSLLLGRINPGINFYIPLDNQAGRIYDFYYGMNLDFAFDLSD